MCSVSSVYEAGTLNEITWVSLSSDSPTTGAVIAIDVFETFPPKMYPARILNPSFCASWHDPETVTLASMYGEYSQTSYQSRFSITVNAGSATRDEKRPYRIHATKRIRRIISSVFIKYIIHTYQPRLGN